MTKESNITRSNLVFERLVIGRDGVDITHPSIQEFIDSRKIAFVEAWGENSRYNTTAPIPYDSWPGTVFILARDSVSNEIVGGTRLLVKEGGHQANELPIARKNGDKKFAVPLHVNIDARECPVGTIFIEPSIFIDIKHKGKGLANQVMADMVKYAGDTFSKYVILVEAAPVSDKVTRKAFNANKSNQTADIGDIYSSFTGTKLAVIATTNFAKERLCLEKAVIIPGNIKGRSISF